MVHKLREMNLMDLYENTLYQDIKNDENSEYYSIVELVLFVYVIKNEFLVCKIVSILMKRIIAPQIDNDQFEQFYDFQEPNKNLENLFKLINLKKLSQNEEHSGKCLVQVIEYLV